LAAETGTTTDHLSFLRSVTAEVRRFGFFALMRSAEARAGRLPRVGRARRPADDVVQLGHATSMDFPAATLAGIETTPAGGARVRGQFLGLTGPMGPLPLHLTEYAVYERRYARSAPFGAFLDLITNRMLQFFYRAWADSQPAAQADRPEDDRYAGYLAAVSGAADGAAPAEAFAGHSRLHYAGLFATRRSAAVLQDAVGGALGLPVRVREFVGRWRDVAPEDQTRLGAGQGLAELGRGALLGGRLRVADDTVRIIARTGSMEAYDSLTPGGARHALAAEVIGAFTPSHLEWELELEIEDEAARPAQLGGGARLGWSTWLQPGRTGGVRADARLRGGIRGLH
jgi:type VI secretion system protein ImpH